MAIEETILKKLTTKSIGIHLANCANLYLKPLSTWRKILNIQRSSYNFLILHLIYYALFIYLLYNDIRIALPIVIAEIVFTGLPWLILIIPFKIFVKILKLRLNGVRLFRLLLILKIQFAPAIIILAILANKLQNDFLFACLQNSIAVFLILFIVVLPLILKMKFYYKICWIFLNYIFILISIALITILLTKLPKVTEDKITKNFTLAIPNYEYLEFLEKTSNSWRYIEDKYYFIVFSKNETHFTIQRTQFVSPFLHRAFLIKHVNEIRLKLQKLDSKNSKKYTLYPKNEELTITMLDSLKENLNAKFFHDLNLFKHYKDSGSFETNKEYFKLRYRYYKMHDSLFTTSSNFLSIINNSKKMEMVQFSDTTYGALFENPQPVLTKIKNKIAIEEIYLDKRLYETFNLNIFLVYPVFLILEPLGIFEEAEESSE